MEIKKIQSSESGAQSSEFQCQYFLFINHPLFDKHQAHLDLRVTDVIQACGEGSLSAVVPSQPG